MTCDTQVSGGLQNLGTQLEAFTKQEQGVFGELEICINGHGYQKIFAGNT